MPNGAKNWTFTINNPNDNDKDLLSKLSELPCMRYLIFQQEIGEEGTPHTQGFVSLKSRKTLNGIKKLVGDRAHVEVAKGSPDQNRSYCSKSKTAVDGTLEEYGEIPKGKGSRNDLEEFKEAAKSGLSKRKALEEFSEVCAKYPRFVSSYIDSLPRVLKLETHELHQWQKDLELKLQGEPDDRKITFVVNPSGNMGKTWFCKYYMNKHQYETQILTPAKKSDMAHAIQDDIRVLFVNISRSFEEDSVKYLYSFIEDVKDGCVFSPKYESGMKFLNPCHVVVMMNQAPAQILTPDRYDNIYI